MRFGNILLAIVSVAYPALVYIGLTTFEPRMLGGLLLAILLLRHWRNATTFWRSMPADERILLALMITLSLAIMIANREWLLRLYPAAMSFSLLTVFGRSLLKPPTIIERIARLREPDLPPEGVRYTRQVTRVWCIFFGLNGIIALATVFASRELWALWNGLLSYLCMGTLFAGEWLVRRHVRRRFEAAA